MEAAVNKSGKYPYRCYGSTVHKQVYIYGTLDPRPTEITIGQGLLGFYKDTDFVGGARGHDLRVLTLPI